MNEQRSYGMMNPSASRLKRKDRESIFPAKRSPLAPPPPLAPAPPPPHPQKFGRATVTSSTGITASKGMEVTSSNKLLAGYMAYEFLTKGTVLGQKFESCVKNQNQNLYQNQKQKQSGIEAGETEKWRKEKESSYKEITSLMMMKSDHGGGIHVPGIVNPTQLDRWIQM
ncbi:hypothetical protein L6452_29925 [Arctium lappa]|uniref:Uncharacterized protein n=1 Tax=Arctium lappa TaxID=4217 RepID=A0ACB8ZII7_ARCLA|nr:hypothetical protein L6452_29925 [Arctium lappa]